MLEEKFHGTVNLKIVNDLVLNNDNVRSVGVLIMDGRIVVGGNSTAL